MKLFTNDTIARKLIIYIFLFSFLITIVLTAVQFTFDYFKEYEALDNKTAQIKDSHLKTIELSLWNLDRKGLGTQLNGMLQLPDLEYVEVLEESPSNSDDSVKVISRGALKSKRTIRKEYPLKYDKDGNDIYLGKLIVVSSLDNIYSRLLNRAAVIFLSNTIITFFVSIFIFFIFQYLVTRHLVKITNYAENINEEKYAKPLSIDRYDIRGRKEKCNDELSKLADAINIMNVKLKKYSDYQRQAAIGQSASMIAHDIRKPFAQMKSVLDMLPDKKDDDAFMEYASRQVDESIRKADAMMSDILEYSRDVKLELSDVGVISMLTSALGDVFKNAEDADVSVEYGYKHTRVVHVEELKIARVLANVLTNAVDAMDRKGKISIQMRDLTVDGKELVELIVANNGSKISEDALPHLFEPFFTKGKKAGTGLGLAICKKIVDAHGGDIRCESTDERTAFIIRLPAGVDEEKIDETGLIRHSSEIRDLMPLEPRQRSVFEDVKLFLDLHKQRGGKSYLLIVDDEPLFRETIRSLINRVPEIRDTMKVIEADSAEVALKQFEARQFDYVITDIDMGRLNLDGYEFARIVLDKYPKSLVLVHSNKRIHGKDESLLGRKNFQGFLPKPMDEGELMHFLAGKVFEQPGQKAYTERKKKNVLVINDEEFMRVALRFELKKAGTVQVMEAAGVNDALRIFKDHSVDVVLADINLGEDRDGYDILSEVRASGSSAKFYMMSGMPKEDEWPKAKEMGADGYIQLPYESADLGEILS